MKIISSKNSIVPVNPSNMDFDYDYSGNYELMGGGEYFDKQLYNEEGMGFITSPYFQKLKMPLAVGAVALLGLIVLKKMRKNR